MEDVRFFEKECRIAHSCGPARSLECGGEEEERKRRIVRISGFLLFIVNREERS